VHDLTGARIEFKKGGVAAVRMGSAPELLVLLRPREIETLARG
jgi:phosphohistidine phosphatase